MIVIAAVAALTAAGATGCTRLACARSAFVVRSRSLVDVSLLGVPALLDHPGRPRRSIPTRCCAAAPKLCCGLCAAAAQVFELFDIKQNRVIEFGEFVRSLSVFHPKAPLAEKAKCECRPAQSRGQPPCRSRCSGARLLRGMHRGLACCGWDLSLHRSR